GAAGLPQHLGTSPDPPHGMGRRTMRFDTNRGQFDGGVDRHATLLAVVELCLTRTAQGQATKAGPRKLTAEALAATALTPLPRSAPSSASATNLSQRSVLGASVPSTDPSNRPGTHRTTVNKGANSKSGVRSPSLARGARIQRDPLNFDRPRFPAFSAIE